MSEADELGDMLARAWRILCRSAGPGSDAALMAMATLSPDGWPEVRMVVLREAEPGAGQVATYIDLHSSKVESLRKSGRVAFTTWHPDERTQIRMTGNAGLIHGPETAARWAALTGAARLNYGQAPRPGAPIAAADAYAKTADPDSFAVLTCRIETMDVVDLAHPHRRALYSRSGDWAGQWLAP